MVSTKLVILGTGVSTALGVSIASIPSALHTADSVLIYLVGAGIQSFVAATIGATLATWLGEPLKPKTKMWAVFLASMAFGAGATAISQKVPGFGWTSGVPDQFMGLVVGFFSRWAIPAIIEHLPATIKRFMSKASGSGGDS